MSYHYSPGAAYSHRLRSCPRHAQTCKVKYPFPTTPTKPHCVVTNRSYKGEGQLRQRCSGTVGLWSNDHNGGDFSSLNVYMKGRPMTENQPQCFKIYQLLQYIYIFFSSNNQCHKDQSMSYIIINYQFNKLASNVHTYMSSIIQQSDDVFRIVLHYRHILKWLHLFVKGILQKPRITKQVIIFLDK